MDLFSEIFSNRWLHLIGYFFYFLAFTGMSNEIMYFFSLPTRQNHSEENIRKSTASFIDFFWDLYFIMNI